MATYRARITKSEAAANGDVHMDVYVEKEVETDVWVLIENGHRTLVLDGEAILAITQETGTAAEKRQAIAALFKQEVLSWKVDRSALANEELQALVPGGWPLDVNLT